MPLLGIIKIDGRVTKDLKQHLDDLRIKIVAEEDFKQQMISEIYSTMAALRTVLNDAIIEVAAEKKRLKKDVFTDRLIRDIFETIRGDEAAFPQRVYENHDAISASYRAGQRNLDALEQNLRREWNEISKMSVSKRKDIVLLARRKLITTIAELEKARERGVEESKRLADEIKNLQGTLQIMDELEEATQDEFYDAKEVQ